MVTKKSIYGSRLFKYSNHQDKILAAITNPINSELISQLSEYVDLSSVNSESDNINITDNNNSKSDKPSTLNDVKNEPTSIDTSNSQDDVVEDDSVVDLEIDENIDEHNDVTSATDVNGSVIQANTAMESEGNRVSTDIILTTINSLDSTSGANRVCIKDDNKELWIYYSDSINLNNVMTQVIDLLDNSGYYYLTFNRLARTDNAIVFDININTTSITETSKDGED